LATGLVILVPYAEKSRIDAPGVLHHIIASGIERRKIFQDYHDRNNFLDRMQSSVGRKLRENLIFHYNYRPTLVLFNYR
jgi:hypothetical protein